MIDRGKRNVLGVDISVVDYDAAVERIVAAARERCPFAVSALAVHGVMTGALDIEHRVRLNRLHLLVPDGQPVRWALNLLQGENLAERVYGPTLMLRVCERASLEGISIFLFGGREHLLAILEQSLIRRFANLQIAGLMPAQYRRGTSADSQEIDRRIADSGAGIVFVGLGCPRQEVFVYEHVDALSRPMIAVGAAFDFHAGVVKQAPQWMQHRGLEWLYRLGSEPRRLWRRYLLLNPLFCWMVARQKLGFGSPKGGTTEPSPMHYC
jgi:exopolysaccharide biosynthesis WecB/TagA/CpsF family protein